MRTIVYPSQEFVEQFDAALQFGAAFEVLITDLRKRLAIVRTIKRLSGEPVEDRFLVSLADKFRLFDFYPCLAAALLSHYFTVESDVLEGRLRLTFQPPPSK